ncbi:methyl-accepting chemotaxis protein [Pseudomonas sp. P2498]|uniref:Methyl-accepting chemotaxis protein n=2 Tax=Pseudomonas petrae TaxID=2912190 RepID=A0ABS9I695_9PSED|nr:methyl-accepting chemotaxis protein [Pseudomonas petrae]MCF7530713.1 methyl-accepting chemotaxis protein [Pseudomonas petrae]MCF7536385.1 methyl-accepting chemotaxis protein [Pseudomonas petrae]MCF7542927.1 methyl-accepting chemotaxis protein [Pseudomonas petrae]MCF7554064.1 methyl-accepting chemotaxis protein [Pseudomonas petrae]
MFSKLTIVQKLSLGFGLIILIICIMVVVVRDAFSKIDNASNWNIHTYTVLDASNKLLISLANIETGMRGFALSGEDDFLAPLTAGKTNFDQLHGELVKLTSDNPTQQQRLAELKATQQKWYGEDIEGSVALRRSVVAGKATIDDVVKRIRERQDKAKMDGMRKLIGDLQQDEQKLLAGRTKSLEDAAIFANLSMIIGGLFAALVALAVAISLSSSIRKRLNVAINAAKNIAAGRLDIQIENVGNDEVGKLLEAFNEMQVRLRTMITAIKGGAEKLLSSATQISHASGELSSAASDQSQSASSMAATVEELTVSISHVAASASEAHGISSASGQHSIEGGAVIQNTLQSMNLIAGTVQSSAQQIADLGRDIQQITSIVNVISAIAEQTNLLALNAAIEAARAGDQGRGFAVVADEVRLLAQRTGKSTSEIGEMIQKIQISAQDAVKQMEVGVEQVNNGLQLANSANTAIDQIRGGSTQIVNVVDQISVALNEQSAASQDVARSVERIAQMAQTSSHGISETARNANAIEQLALMLEKQVAQFKL